MDTEQLAVASKCLRAAWPFIQRIDIGHDGNTLESLQIEIARALQAICEADGEAYVEEFHILGTALWMRLVGIEIEDIELYPVSPYSAAGELLYAFAHVAVGLEKRFQASGYESGLYGADHAAEYLQDIEAVQHEADAAEADN